MQLCPWGNQVAQFVTIDGVSSFQGLAKALNVPTQALDACTATFFGKLAPFTIPVGWKGVQFANNMANRVRLGTFSLLFYDFLVQTTYKQLSQWSGYQQCTGIHTRATRCLPAR
jgi:hypothetical protein